MKKTKAVCSHNSTLYRNENGDYLPLTYRTVHPMAFEDEEKEVTYLDNDKKFIGNLWIAALLYLFAFLVGACNLISNRHIHRRNAILRIRLGLRRFKRLIGLRR